MFTLERWICVATFFHVAGGTQWVEHTGTCYWVDGNDVTYVQAEARCGELGSVLVEVEELGKHLIVNDLLNRYPTSLQLEAWVSMSHTSSGVFEWTRNKTKAAESMWRQGEPNQSGYCVRLSRFLLGVDYGWYYLADHPCFMKFRPFCQKPASLDAVRLSRLTTLPQYLCISTGFSARSFMGCTRECSLKTSCYVLGFNTQSLHCSFHALQENCTHIPVLDGTTHFYTVSRQCS